MKKLSLDKLKEQFVGKQFNWLTINDIYRNEDLKKWFAICQCKCGKVIHKQINKVTSGHLKSCGCFVKSDEFADKRRDWCANNSSKIRRYTGKTLEQNIELLNNQYVNNMYNWLTVLEVFPVFYENGRLKRYDVKCKCKCGKDTITRLNYVISGHTKSCGCYNHSKEHNAALSKFWKDNPDKVKERANKRSEWYKNNPDKVVEQGKRHSQWYKNNPDKVKEKSAKYKQWRKDNPDKLIEQSKARSQYLKDNPDVLKTAGKKISQWYKDNPDKVKEKSEKLSKRYKDNPEAAAEIGRRISEWYKNNPDKVHARAENFKKWCKNNQDKLKTLGKKHSQYYKDNPDVGKNAGNKTATYYKNNRLKCDVSALLDVIHPDYIEQLSAGSLRSGDIIKTRCRLCNNYDEHMLGNIFVLSRSEFKYGISPLCTKCRNDLCIIVSKYEQEIADYISTFYSGELIRNDRIILSGKELDLYYPEKKIAIEFNGDYWHNENHKSKDYHYNKFKACLDHNILLISIFELEWNSKKEEIKNYIQDTFNGVGSSISFKGDLMNNSYPSLECLSRLGEYVEESYSVNDVQIFTCGYSKVISNT